MLKIRKEKKQAYLQECCRVSQFGHHSPTSLQRYDWRWTRWLTYRCIIFQFGCVSSACQYDVPSGQVPGRPVRQGDGAYRRRKLHLLGETQQCNVVGRVHVHLVKKTVKTAAESKPTIRITFGSADGYKWHIYQHLSWHIYQQVLSVISI